MINLNELKPGNVALFENEKIIIKSIHSTPLRTDVVFRKLNLFRKWEESYTTKEKIKFISLSKNIFLNSNFSYFFDKEKENGYYANTINGKHDKSFFIVENQNYFKFFGFGIHGKIISHIHEFQNLYYSIKHTNFSIEEMWDLDEMSHV